MVLDLVVEHHATAIKVIRTEADVLTSVLQSWLKTVWDGIDLANCEGPTKSLVQRNAHCYLNPTPVYDTAISFYIVFLFYCLFVLVNQGMRVLIEGFAYSTKTGFGDVGRKKCPRQETMRVGM